VRVRAKIKKSVRAADLLAEKLADSAFAELFHEDLAALRLGLALREVRELCGMTQGEVETRTRWGLCKRSPMFSVYGSSCAPAMMCVWNPLGNVVPLDRIVPRTDPRQEYLGRKPSVRCRTLFCVHHR
jgi:hypothetical protein